MALYLCALLTPVTVLQELLQSHKLRKNIQRKIRTHFAQVCQQDNLKNASKKT
jgi:hypothetical protein